MRGGLQREPLGWADFRRTLSTVPNFPEAVEIQSVSHEGRSYRAHWKSPAPESPPKPRTEEKHQTDWDNDYLLYTLLCRDKVDEHYTSSGSNSHGTYAAHIDAHFAKNAKKKPEKAEPDHATNAALESRTQRKKLLQLSEAAALARAELIKDSVIQTHIDAALDEENEGLRMEQMVRFFDAHASEMAVDEQVQMDPFFKRLRAKRAQREAALVSAGLLPASPRLRGASADSDVFVQKRQPYVRGALEKARRDAREQRRKDRDAAVGTSAETRRPEEGLQDETARSGDELGHAPSAAKASSHREGETVRQSVGDALKTAPRAKAKQQVQRGERKVTLVLSDSAEADGRQLPPVKDLICEEGEDGFVHLERDGTTTFRYKVRLVNGEVDERTFDLRSDPSTPQTDASQPISVKQSPSSEEKKSRQRSDEKSWIADAVMKQASLLRGNLDKIEKFERIALQRVTDSSDSHDIPPGLHNDA